MLLGDLSPRQDNSLIAESCRLSALGVLKQCPVPVIAVAHDGTVLFANSAFAHFLDYSCEAITSLSYEDICSVLPADETLFAVTRLRPNVIGSLMLSGQVTVFVKMRRSAILSRNDSYAVAMCKELMERLSR
ncbi:MAG: PAS domain-containing protein [Mycobacterium sp.]